MKCTIILLLAVLLLLGFASCMAASNPIKTSLSFSDQPTLNNPVTVFAKFETKPDGLNVYAVKARIVLAEGFQLVSGNLEWSGNLTKNQELTVEATVKTIKLGTCYIYAEAMAEGQSGFSYDWWYVTVTENKVFMSKKSPVRQTTTQEPYQTNPPPGYPTPSTPPATPVK